MRQDGRPGSMEEMWAKPSTAALSPWGGDGLSLWPSWDAVTPEPRKRFRGGRGKLEAWHPVVGMQSGVVATESPPEVKNRTIVWFSNSISGYLPRKIAVGISKRYLHSRAHRSMSHKSQDAKTTKVSVLGWTDETNMVYTRCGILFSLKKEGSSAVCDNTEECWRQTWS